MLDADDDVRCVVHTNARAVGALPRTPGYYREQLVLNHLTTPVLVIDAFGTATELPPLPDVIVNRRVEVRRRTVIGARTTNVRNEDITACDHLTREVPDRVLLIGPVYLREFDLVICLPEHRSFAVHPNSRAYLQAQVHDLHDQVINHMRDVPLAIVANDPSGRVKQLYVDVNGRVCQIAVTHFNMEDDDIVIAYRDAVANGHARYSQERTTFRELGKQKHPVMSVGGVTFSTSAEHLKAHMEHMQTQSSVDVVPLALHRSRLDEARRADHDELVRMKEITERQKKRITQLETELKELTDVAYSERHVALKTHELSNQERRFEVEQAKLEAEAARLAEERQSLSEERQRLQTKQQHEAALAKGRLWEEGMKLVTTVLKTLAVMIPLALSLYKLMAPKPA